MIAWSLGACIAVILICLIAFVIILLLGNSLVSSGVGDGKETVGTILPEVRHLCHISPFCASLSFVSLVSL